MTLIFPIKFPPIFFTIILFLSYVPVASSSKNNLSNSLDTSSNSIISPTQAVKEMKIGINLGNTLDAYPNEGDWAPKAEQYYFSKFANAGFKHVRIPVTWDTHTNTSPPYTIDESMINRVEEVVDWALDEGLYVIINAHHETWLKTNYTSASNRARFDAIWKQIAERFKEKSPKLLFEILNEPVGMTADNINELNQRILQIIRIKNPTRLVIFSGNSYTPLSSLLATKILKDNYIIGNFHAYTPWEFAGLCQQSWGTKSDIASLKYIYQKAYNWSKKNNIPVMINEFGVAKYNMKQPEKICAQKDRLLYLKTHVGFAKQYGISATVWDNGGEFSLYNRAKNTWTEDKNVIIQDND